MSDLQERLGPEEREVEKKLGEIPGDENAGKMVPGIEKNDKHAALYYKILIGLYIALPFSIIGGPFIAVVAIGVLVAGLVTLALGIMALIEIKKSKGALRSNQFVIPAIVMPLIIILTTCFILKFGTFRPFSLLHDYEYTTKELYMVFTDYAEKNNGQWPEASKWCDIAYEGNNNRVYKECDFSLNSYAVPAGNKMPGNMVLLFQSRTGWNQTGGQELLVENPHRGYICVLFGDGHAELVKIKDVPYLRWKLEDDGIIPVIDKTIPYTVVIGILSLAAIGFLVSQRRYLVKHWFFAILLGVASSGIGYLFGFVSEVLYATSEKVNLIGWQVGIIAGFVVGICFVVWLSRIRNRTEPQISIVGSGTLAGAVAGILCSSIVHLLLLIHHEESNPANLLAGMSFGVWAGLVLSWVSCAIFDYKYKIKAEEVIYGNQ